MSQAPLSSDPAHSQVPSLKSLGPKYVEKLHGRHAAVLLNALSDQSADAARNIALAGHYGSGKSSVILGLQAGLTKRKTRWVNLSLSSLTVEDTEKARIRDDGTPAPLTNLIQKEIVKQLLYRKAPADMPGSRYFRIDSFRPTQALPWVIATTLGVFVLAWLAGLAGRAAAVSPASLVNEAPWVPWATVALVAILAGGLCFLTLRALHNRFQVDSVSAGGAAVSLSARENSYFDEYLDEIVYFFQLTKTEVAVFEDLDRFKDPYIFETLRELNTVLNNSEQIQARPIRFIYAVRDSIFERLEDDSQASDGRRPKTVDPSWRAEKQESAPSSNRTKFFDLVVPMVPFITHRSVRDLLVDEFAGTPQPPSADLINLVGGATALTDMRLISNIRNEYEVYRASVLSDNGLEGLTPDRLFAMMVYKNTHLDDFEAIRLGTSQIDAAHRAFRDMVLHQVRHQAAQSRRALAQAGGMVPWDERAKAAGEKLQQLLPILHKANRYANGEPHLIHASGTYTMESLTSGQLWKQLHESRDSVDVGQPGYYTVSLSFNELLQLAGHTGWAMAESVAARVAELEQSSRAALETKEFVARATMAELLARTDLTMPFDDGRGARSLRETVSGLVSPLALDLLVGGYIDENYTLYCSDYHGVALSVSAMNFILHCVQPDQADPLFAFDAPSSIDEVASEMGDRFFKGESVFNVAVFEHYLAKDVDRLANALDRLTTRASSGDTAFIDLLLGNSAVATNEDLVGELVSRWTRLFVHLVETLESETAIALVDTAAQRAVARGDYESSDQVRRFLQEHYAEMKVFVDPIDEGGAADLASLVRKLEVTIPRLDALGQMQLSAMTSAALYPVSRANIASALGDDAAVALDVVRGRNTHVYDHVRTNLQSYVDFLREDEITVEDPGHFLAVLNEIVGVPDDLVEAVAQRAIGVCEVADLEELDPAAWAPVVAAGRYRKSARNVSRYIGELGVTAELCRSLAGRGFTDVDGLDEQRKAELACAVLEGSWLPPKDRASLVSQLQLTGYLDPADFGAGGLTLLPLLLSDDQVPDEVPTYAFIADRPYDFREEYLTSSSRLSEYITQLPLSSDDVARVMRSRNIKPDVKRAVADDFGFVADRLSPAAADAICEWAAKGNEVSTQLLLVLSRASGSVGKYLLVLEARLSDVDMSELDTMLRGLGDTFEPLTRLGRHRPHLPEGPGVEALLDELKRRQRVSSYKRATFGGFSVYMRR